MISSFLGIVFHAIGGLAAGSFYLPLKKVSSWSWESAWLVNGVFAWMLAPTLVATISIPNAWEIIIEAETATLLWTYLFGILWGIGGLTFGLSMRFLGIGLGMAMALGLTAAFGTIVPPIYDGSFFTIIQEVPGQIVLIGVVSSLLGIVICGKAGMMKEAQLSDEEMKEGVKEFNLRKGIIVAFFAGLMSSCFAFGIQSGAPLAEAALASGTPSLWVNGSVFIVILLGGATTNFGWCLYLNFKNATYQDYSNTATPLRINYTFSALAGIIWYAQFMFYGMGTTQMGEHDFSSWSIHMSFIIVFSTLWGIVTKEWKGVSKKTLIAVILGLLALILSTGIIGYGNHLFSG